MSSFFFFFNDTATTEIYTLSLHDALPICLWDAGFPTSAPDPTIVGNVAAQRCHFHREPAHKGRSEEHTSELQPPCNLVCRLLLEKKKENNVIALHPPTACTRLRLEHSASL